MKTKICQQCGIEHPIKNFSSERGGRCKDCKIKGTEVEIKNMLSQGVIPSKVCSCCGLTKSYLLYYTSIWKTFGRMPICAECENTRKREYKIKQKEVNKTLVIQEKECSICLKVKDISNFRKCSSDYEGYATFCMECKKSQPKIISTEKYCHQCDQMLPIQMFVKSSYTYDGLNTCCKSCHKKYRQENQEKINFAQRRKYNTDANFKTALNIRNRINGALDGNMKSARSEVLLGMSFIDFVKYLKSLFEPGMTMENHTINGWHIDHIIPCDFFDLSDPEEQKKCFHYTNLMPRWATTSIALAHGSSQIGNANKGSQLLPAFM